MVLGNIEADKQTVHDRTVGPILSSGFARPRGPRAPAHHPWSVGHSVGRVAMLAIGWDHATGKTATVIRLEIAGLSNRGVARARNHGCFSLARLAQGALVCPILDGGWPSRMQRSRVVAALP